MPQLILGAHLGFPRPFLTNKYTTYHIKITTVEHEGQPILISQKCLEVDTSNRVEKAQC
jgi:hypothetical protein